MLTAIKKTGKDIANLVLLELQKHNIPLEQCRGQGYDNGSNMSGKYNGAQAIISGLNPLAKFSNCGAHSLNLVGATAAECSEDVFFWSSAENLQLFSHSPIGAGRYYKKILVVLCIVYHRPDGQRE